MQRGRIQEPVIGPFPVLGGGGHIGYGAEEALGPGSIGIQGQDQVLGEPPEEREVFFGYGQAHGGYRLGVARLVGNDDIHIPLYDNGPVLLAGGLSGPVQAVEEAALIKDGGLGGVEVFGDGLVPSSPPPPPPRPEARMASRL